MNRRVLLAAALALPAQMAFANLALAQEPIVFGVITPLSPPGETSLGQQVKRGSEIAVEYLNEKGGVLGRKVVLSIQAGQVMPSMLLRKLGTYNRRSLLYRAFRELGRVERTLFLLRFFSSIEVRRVIRAETTKIEAFNDFLDWVSFGGPVIKSGDPVEQEKQLKYASLVANTIMLSNVADLTSVLSDMAADGHPVTPGLVAGLSPYTRSHILRFGQYVSR